MAKLKEKIGADQFEVEGDAEGCALAMRQFHLTLAERELRVVERLMLPLDAKLEPLKRQAADLRRTVRALREQRVSVSAVDPVGDNAEGQR